MPRRHSGPRAPLAAESASHDVRDSVDRLVAEWAVEMPDLPVAPAEVLARLARVRSHVDEQLAATFAGHDLTAADFTVIAALRRSGDPFALAQSTLMERLRLTSGTVSVRLNRLAGKGVVTRAPSSTDGRGVLVTLTDRGVELFDRVAPAHLAGEDVLLSALTVTERVHLAALLRKLLVSFEHERSHSPAGFTVAPAHLARRARAAVGLGDRAGLLVQHVDPGGPADRAGMQPGDLVVAADDHDDLRSCVDLARVVAAARADGRRLFLHVVRGEHAREVDLLVPTTRVTHFADHVSGDFCQEESPRGAASDSLRRRCR